MKSKSKISALTLLVAACGLSIGLVSCGGRTSTPAPTTPSTPAPTTPVTPSTPSTPSTPTTPTTPTPTPTTPTPTTPIGREYVVRFYDLNGDSLGTVNVREGQTIDASAIPTKTDDGKGHAFAGWYTTTNQEFDESTPITSNLNLSARYFYKVTFAGEGTTVYGTQEVVSGFAIDTESIPEAEAPDHYGFDRWMSGNSEYLMSSPVDGDLTLTASFVYVLEGLGTQVSPFLLETREDVYQFANLVNSSAIHPSGAQYNSAIYSLSNDIALDAEVAFTPIQNFSGSLEGNGHSITNVVIEAVSDSNLGFFASTYGTTISNLKLSVTIVEGQGQSVANSLIGGLVASAESTIIQGVQITDNIAVGLNHLTRPIVGGLVGSGVDVTIDSCIILGNVRGGESIGGIVGSLTGNSFVSQVYVDVGFAAFRSATIGVFAGYSESTATVYNCWFNGGFYGSNYIPSEEITTSFYGLGNGNIEMCFVNDEVTTATVPWSKENFDLSNTEPALRIVPTTHSDITISYSDGSDAEATTSNIPYGSSFSTAAEANDTSIFRIGVSDTYYLSLGELDVIYSSQYPLYADVTLVAMYADYFEIINTLWQASSTEYIAIDSDDGALVTVTGAVDGVEFEDVSATVIGQRYETLRIRNGSLYTTGSYYNTASINFTVEGEEYRVYIQRVIEGINYPKGYLVFETNTADGWEYVTGSFNSPLTPSNYEYSTYYYNAVSDFGFYMNKPEVNDEGGLDYVIYGTDGNIYTYQNQYLYNGNGQIMGVTFTMFNEDGVYVKEFAYTQGILIELFDYEIGATNRQYAPSADVLEGTYVATSAIPSDLISGLGSSSEWGEGEALKEASLDDYTFTIQYNDETHAFEVVYQNSIYAGTPTIITDPNMPGALGLRFEIDGRDFVIAMYGTSSNGVSMLLVEVDTSGNVITTSEVTSVLESMDEYIGGIWENGIAINGYAAEDRSPTLIVENSTVTLGESEVEYTYALIALAHSKTVTKFAIKFEIDSTTYYLTYNNIQTPILYRVVEEDGSLVATNYLVDEDIRYLASVFSVTLAVPNTENTLAVTPILYRNATLSVDTTGYLYYYSYDETTVCYYLGSGEYYLTDYAEENILVNFDYIPYYYILFDEQTKSIIRVGFQTNNNKYVLIIDEDEYELVYRSGFLTVTIGENGYYIVGDSGYLLFCQVSGGYLVPVMGAVEAHLLDELYDEIGGTYIFIDSSGDSVTLDITNETLVFSTNLSDAEQHFNLYYDAINEMFFAYEVVDNVVADQPTFAVYYDSGELVYFNGQSEIAFYPQELYTGYTGSWTAHGVNASYSLSFDGRELKLEGPDASLTYSTFMYDTTDVVPCIIGQSTLSLNLDSTSSGTAVISQIQAYNFGTFLYVFCAEFEVSVVEGRITSTLSSRVILNGVIFESDTLAAFNGIYAIPHYDTDITNRIFVTYQDGSVFLSSPDNGYVAVTLAEGEDYDYAVVETQSGDMAIQLTILFNGHVLIIQITVDSETGAISYGYLWDPSSN